MRELLLREFQGSAGYPYSWYFQIKGQIATDQSNLVLTTSSRKQRKLSSRLEVLVKCLFMDELPVAEHLTEWSHWRHFLGGINNSHLCWKCFTFRYSRGQSVFNNLSFSLSFPLLIQRKREPVPDQGLGKASHKYVWFWSWGGEILLYI